MTWAAFYELLCEIDAWYARDDGYTAQDLLSQLQKRVLERMIGE